MIGAQVVLLVEDNRADQVLIREALDPDRSLGLLHVVQDGEEAMSFLRKSHAYTSAPRPDLIIVDLNLPKKSGREVLEEIKNDIDLKRIPVIVLTSSKDQREIERCYEAGANCYLTKRADLEEHLSMLRSAAAFWLSLVHLPARTPPSPGKASRGGGRGPVAQR